MMWRRADTLPYSTEGVWNLRRPGSQLLWLDLKHLKRLVSSVQGTIWKINWQLQLRQWLRKCIQVMTNFHLLNLIRHGIYNAFRCNFWINSGCQMDYPKEVFSMTLIAMINVLTEQPDYCYYKHISMSSQFLQFDFTPAKYCSCYRLLYCLGLNGIFILISTPH